MKPIPSTRAAHRPFAACRSPAALGRAVLVVTSLAAFASSVSAQHDSTAVAVPIDGVDFRVYDRDGQPSSLLAIIGAAVDADVVLVGEEHDDMVGHAFEAALYDTAIAELGAPGRLGGRRIVLSLEMFERDVQYIVDEYLAGAITEDHFLSSARPWDDYEARYRPLVESAKANGFPVVAANAPRRYVNRVTRSGPESLQTLSDVARSYLPPLPFPGPSERYQAQWDALMAAAMSAIEEQDSTSATEEEVADEAAADEAPADQAPADEAVADEGPDHGMSSNAIQAQALWDAAMGHAVATALVEHLGSLVVHFAGSFHVERDTGIPERVRDYRPGTRVTTVVMTKVDDIDGWSRDDHGELADFVVLTKAPAKADGN